MASKSPASELKKTALTTRDLVDRRVEVAQEKYEALQAYYDHLLGRLQSPDGVESDMKSEVPPHRRQA